MPLMSSTADVFQVSGWLKLVAPQNMPNMSVTPVVSQLFGGPRNVPSVRLHAPDGTVAMHSISYGISCTGQCHLKSTFESKYGISIYM